jgi:5-methylcytosine-specific restriction enzyme A
MCNADGCDYGATQVDHIIPHKGAGDPNFYNVDNLQALCASCHSKKTAKDKAGGLTRDATTRSPNTPKATRLEH